MFRRNKKNTEFSIERSTRKFLSNRDTSQRIKHLKLLIANLSTAQIKQFFSERHSEIFHYFFDFFDTDLRSKSSILHLKDLEGHLLILEKLLVYLPELFNKRWQISCILGIIRYLLHNSNTLAVQITGLRLFILWFQILGNNATSACTDIFIHLVPELGALYDIYKTPKNKHEKKDEGETESQKHRNRHASVFSKNTVFMEPFPLIPTNNMDEERQAFLFLRYILRFSVTEVDKIQWSQSSFDQRPLCFWFLFEQLKRYYFPAIFPKITASYSIFDGGFLPSMMTNVSEYSIAPENYPISEARLAIYQEEIIRWLAEFLYVGPRVLLPSRQSPGLTPTNGVRKHEHDQSQLSGNAPSQSGASESSSSGVDGGANNSRQSLQVNGGDRSITHLSSSIDEALLIESSLPVGGIATSTNSAILKATGTGMRELDKNLMYPLSAPQLNRSFNSSMSRGHLLSVRDIKQTVQGYFAEHTMPDKTIGLESVFPNQLDWAVECNQSMINRVREVLYYCRQNIDLIHSIFYHASLLPLDRYKALFCVVLVYCHWILEKPVFMRSSESNSMATVSHKLLNGSGRNLADSQSIPQDTLSETSTLIGAPQTKSHIKVINSSDGDNERRNEYGATLKPRESVSQSRQNDPPSSQTNDLLNSPSTLPIFLSEDVGGAMQTTYQIMLTNVSHLFLRLVPLNVVTSVELVDRVIDINVNFMRQQIALCNLVLDKLIQPMTLSNELSTETCEKLLFDLMKIISEVMTTISHTVKFDFHWLSHEKILSKIFQTLNSALIYSTLWAPISNAPWDRCLEIYSKITYCPALINEWKKTMDMLTRRLSIVVFEVDLHNLPVEEKNKRGRRTFGKPLLNQQRFQHTNIPLGTHSKTGRPAQNSSSRMNATADGISRNSRTRHPKITTSALSSSIGEGKIIASLLPSRGTPAINSNSSSSGRSSKLHPSVDDGDDSFPEFSDVRTPTSPNFVVSSLGPGITSVFQESWDMEDGGVGGDDDDDDIIDEALISPSSNCVIHFQNICPEDAGSDIDDVQLNREIPLSSAASKQQLFHRCRSTSVDRAPVVARLNDRKSNARLSQSTDRFNNLTKVDHQTNSSSNNISDYDSTPDTPRRPFFSGHQSNLTENYQRSLPKSMLHHKNLHFHHNRLSHSECGVHDGRSRKYPPQQNLHAGGSNNIQFREMLNTAGLTDGERRVNCLANPGLRHLHHIHHTYHSMDTSTPLIDQNGEYSQRQVKRSLDDPDSVRQWNIERGGTLTNSRSINFESSQRLDQLTIKLENAGTTSTEDSLLSAPVPHKSVLVGGQEPGWTADSTIVCWRRFLGLLGDISQIETANVMTVVLAYISCLAKNLLKIDAYQALVFDEDGQPRLPVDRVPIDFLMPLLFKVFSLPMEFVEAKKLSIQILSTLLIRQHDIEPTGEVLAQFYRLLHQAIGNKEERFSTEVIQSDCWKMFAFSLPGSNLLCLDFVNAADHVLNDRDKHNSHLRASAMSLLVTLLPLHCHYGNLQAFNSDVREIKVKEVSELWLQLATKIYQGVLKESTVEARQIAICGLCMVCREKLSEQQVCRYRPEKPPVTQSCVVALLRCTRLSNHSVALTAMTMLRLLAESADLLFDISPTSPLIIIQALSWNLAFLWSQIKTDDILSPIFKQLLTTNIVTLIDWTMAIPLPVLISPFTDLSQERKRSSTISSSLLRKTQKLEPTNTTTILAGVFNVLEFVASAPKMVSMELIGPGWVPGCPFFDPLFGLLPDVDEKQFCDPGHGVGDCNGPLSPFGECAGHSLFVTSRPITPECIRMSARFASCHLYTQIGRFPLTDTMDLIDSLVQEQHDGFGEGDVEDDVDELTLATLDMPGLQMFVLNRSFLVSVFPIWRKEKLAHDCHGEDADDDWASRTGHEISSDLLAEKVITDTYDVRLIVRDLSGKYSWDASHIYGLLPDHTSFLPDSFLPPPSDEAGAGVSKTNDINSSSGDASSPTPPCPPPRQRIPVHQIASVSKPLDVLAKLLNELASQHPEFTSMMASADGSIKNDDGEVCMTESAFENLAIDQVSALQKEENKILKLRQEPNALPFYSSHLPSPPNEEMERWSEEMRRYAGVKQLLCQLGFMSRDRRPNVELLCKSNGLLRELKHLDKRRSRETHKFAVVYIAPGQEDKKSILSNQQGSLEWENFVVGLGWPVELGEHRGFLGGLAQDGQNGTTAIYYATSTMEVLFHVSTKMPSETDEDRHRMYKHLGNDEVMIIWSEHWRPFRRSTLRTEFGDVLIIICPLANGLFRIEVRKEPEVPFFGPLFDGMIVTEENLSSLVRATAINANHAIHSTKPDFKENHEERYLYLQTIITNYMQSTAFEDFVMEVVMPKLPPGSENFGGNCYTQLNISIPQSEMLRSPGAPIKELSSRARIKRHIRRRRQSESDNDALGPQWGANTAVNRVEHSFATTSFRRLLPTNGAIRNHRQSSFDVTTNLQPAPTFSSPTDPATALIVNKAVVKYDGHRLSNPLNVLPHCNSFSAISRHAPRVTSSGSDNALSPHEVPVTPTAAASVVDHPSSGVSFFSRMNLLNRFSNRHHRHGDKKKSGQ